jgi:L-amino acid N-acyltransferase YncA
MTLSLRPFETADWAEMWPIIQSVAQAGDTYAYEVDLPEDDARRQWVDEPTHTVVARDDTERLLGFAKAMPNRPGPGKHIANASFMVSADARGSGVGRQLVTYVLDWTKAAGFRAIQFNAVVSTNAGAVKLYRSLGFDVVGTSPEAFRLPDGSYADLLIMHRRL